MMNSSVTCKNPGHLSRTSSWDIDLDEAHSTCPIRQDRRGQSASLITPPHNRSTLAPQSSRGFEGSGPLTIRQPTERHGAKARFDEENNMSVHCKPDDSPVSGTNDGTYGDLLVCGTCGMIKGPVPALPGSATQLCECVPVEVHRAQPKWDRHDFNRLRAKVRTMSLRSRIGIVCPPILTAQPGSCATCKTVWTRPHTNANPRRRYLRHPSMTGIHTHKRKRSHRDWRRGH
jgi:hypothetical protein